MTTMSCPLVEQLETIPDPRRQCRNLKHRLVDVLLSGFCGVLAGCDNFVEIADWARHHEEFLCTFLELPNGIPSHDTYNRVFATARPLGLGLGRKQVLGFLQARPGLSQQ